MSRFSSFEFRFVLKGIKEFLLYRDWLNIYHFLVSKHFEFKMLKTPSIVLFKASLRTKRGTYSPIALHICCFVNVIEKQWTGTGAIKRQIPLLKPKREINKYYK